MAFVSLPLYEPCRKNTCLGGLRPGQTQTGLYIHRRVLEARNFRFRKKRDFTIYVTKAKAMISCPATVQLICAFVLAFAKSQFS